MIPILAGGLPGAPLLQRLMRVRRLIHLQAVHALKPLHLGPKQASLLRRLSLLGPACCLSDLSKATASDPAAVGRIVDGLIRKGWVQDRAKVPGGDRRRREVTLSPAGRKLAAQVETVFAQLDRRMAATLSKDEVRQFSDLMDKMAGRLA